MKNYFEKVNVFLLFPALLLKVLTVQFSRAYGYRIKIAWSDFGVKLLYFIISLLPHLHFSPKIVGNKKFCSCLYELYKTRSSIIGKTTTTSPKLLKKFISDSFCSESSRKGFPSSKKTIMLDFITSRQTSKCQIITSQPCLVRLSLYYFIRYFNTLIRIWYEFTTTITLFNGCLLEII